MIASTGKWGRISLRKSPAQDRSRSFLRLGPRYAHGSKRACASVPDVKHEFSRNGLIFKENCTKTSPGSQGESDRKAKKISRLSKSDFLRGRQFITGPITDLTSPAGYLTIWN